MTENGKLLDGRVALITGGAQGIGKAVAAAYVAQGARVVIADLNAETLAQAVAELSSDTRGKVRAAPLDVTDEAATEAVISDIRSSEGELDICVPNAGILVLAHTVDTDLAAWRRVIEINLTGAFITARAAARAMIAAGRGGRIIFTSSLFGLRGGMENAAYSASKFGMNGLMQCMAAELARHNVLVNSVCPGQMDTAMIRQLFRDRAQLRGESPEALQAAFEARIPLGRLGPMDELAGTYVYLASGLSNYVTGQSLVVDGGWQVA